MYGYWVTKDGAEHVVADLYAHEEAGERYLLSVHDPAVVEADFDVDVYERMAELGALRVTTHGGFQVDVRSVPTSSQWSTLGRLWREHDTSTFLFDVMIEGHDAYVSGESTIYFGHIRRAVEYVLRTRTSKKKREYELDGTENFPE